MIGAYSKLNKLAPSSDPESPVPKLVRRRARLLAEHPAEISLVLEPDQARDFGNRVLRATQKRFGLQDAVTGQIVPGGDSIFVVKDTQQVNFSYAHRLQQHKAAEAGERKILAVILGGEAGLEIWDDLVAKIVKELGGIDIFASNAGTIRHVLEIDFSATIVMMQPLIPPRIAALRCWIAFLPGAVVPVDGGWLTC